MRNERIDTVRGIAIAWVLLIHVYSTANYHIAPVAEWYQGILGSHTGRSIEEAVHNMQPGVNLFWFVSGFCIHTSFLRWWRRTPAPDRSLSGFLPGYAKARFWRVYPPYLIVIGVCFVAGYWPQLLELRSFKHLLVHALCIQNYLPPFMYNINGPCWSIAVELQRYMIYPVLLVLWIRFGRTRAFAACVVMALLARYVPLPVPDRINLWYSPFACWIGWLAGALLAEHWALGLPLFKRHALAVSACALLCATALLLHVRSDLVQLGMIVGYAAAFEAYILMKSPARRIETLLGKIGAFSFSIYLLHGPIMTAILVPNSALFSDFSVATALLLAIAVTTPPILLISWVFYKWVELPFGRHAKT